MNREQWRELQRALHPKDLESVQRFAEKLALDHPFVFVSNGTLSFSLDGPGVFDMASALLGELAGVPYEPPGASSVQ
jgi:hypothetical protein